MVGSLNQVGSSFSNDVGRGLSMGRWNMRLGTNFCQHRYPEAAIYVTHEDRGVNDADTAYVLNGQIAVHDFADLCGTRRVTRGRCTLASVLNDTFRCGGVGRVDVRADDEVAPRRSRNVALRCFDSLDHDGHVEVVRKESWVNQWRVERVAGAEAYVTTCDDGRVGYLREKPA